MMNKKLALIAIALAPLAIGCGGDDTTLGGGAMDMSMPLFKVQSGTYSVSNLAMQGTDTCMQNLDAMNFTTLGVVNDGHGTLSLGSNNSSYLPDPALYTQGTGMFMGSYNVTTHLDAMANATGCMYHLVRNDVVTVVADDKLNVQYTQMQTNHMGTCTVVTTDCMSAYNFTLSMPVK